MLMLMMTVQEQDVSVYADMHCSRNLCYSGGLLLWCMDPCIHACSYVKRRLSHHDTITSCSRFHLSPHSMSHRTEHCFQLHKCNKTNRLHLSFSRVFFSAATGVAVSAENVFASFTKITIGPPPGFSYTEAELFAGIPVGKLRAVIVFRNVTACGRACRIPT
jgi:hypothetical protein